MLVDRLDNVETLDLLAMLVSKGSRVLRGSKVAPDHLDPAAHLEPRDKLEQLVTLEQQGKLEHLDKRVSRALPDNRVPRVELVSPGHQEGRANRELLAHLDRREYQPRSVSKVCQVTRDPWELSDSPERLVLQVIVARKVLQV